MKSSLRVSIAALGSMVSYALLVPASQAETRTTSEYIAIDFAAETFDVSDDRWVLTEPATAQTSPDPDPNHSDTAGGNAYLELLPDIRVTHSDPTSPPVAYWGNAGSGPTLEYEIDFPEAGRYHVHVRALSTGTEDNGIFVGLNNDWPASGLRLQFCTANQGWRWSSAQRDSGDDGPCGIEKTIWVTVENPGLNTVKFSAREDGFEFDHFMLIKDKSVNTRVCSPVNESDIQCVDSYIDAIADMSVELQSDRSSGVVGDTVELTATVSNLDSYDDAENVSVAIDADLGTTWELLDVDSRCAAQGEDVVCDLATIAPTQAGDEIVMPLQLRALTVGAHLVSATVSSSNDDSNAENNADAVTVDVEEAIDYTTAESTGVWAPGKVDILEPVELTVSVLNTGGFNLDGTEVILELPQEFEVTGRPSECTGLSTLTCSIGVVAPGSSKDIVIVLESDVEGFHTMVMTTRADNLEQGSMAAVLIVTVLPLDAERDVDSEGENAAAQDAGGALGWAVLFLFLSLTLMRLQAPSLSLSRLR